MNQIRFLHNSLAQVTGALLAVLSFACPASPAPKNYSPKSSDETEILSLALKAEVRANAWTQNETTCFSVGNMEPSQKLVKTLQKEGLNVRSAAEWRKRFNCRFEVRLQFVSTDVSQKVRLHVQVVDLRDINNGEGDLALIQRDGEYQLQKTDGNWSISSYEPVKQSPVATDKSGCGASQH